MGTYLELTDTPGSYSGKGAQFVAVKAGEDGLEFVEAGAQGPQGPQGYMGEQGVIGEGVQGDQGPEGAQGDQGQQGWMGVQGPSGIGAGEQGYQGDQGYQGETGPQGTQGVTGDQGETGEQGYQGFQGDTGDTGDQGPQGYQGVQGEQGAATFLELTDVPGSYSGEGDKIVGVKAAEDGLEFVASIPGAVPVGVILAWLGGYFTDGVNGGYTRVLGTANTIAAVNALLNGDGWYVCDGALLNLGGSPIFDGAGRYLPKLTDDRFIMGDTLGGTPGGNNAMAHTHPSGTLGTSTVGDHGHGNSFSTNSESAHTHAYGNLGVSGGATNNHTLSVAQMPNHNHVVYGYLEAQAGAARGNLYPSTGNYNRATTATGGNGAHNHGVSLTLNTGDTATGTAHNHGMSGSVHAGGGHSHSVNTGATGAASNTENRPKFLGCFYIMRAI